MPVRIYDIAKKLGIESKEVLIKAKMLGISAAKVPSSSLDKLTAEYLWEQLGGSGGTAWSPPVEPPPFPLLPPPPRVGDKVGFIQLPAKAPRDAEACIQAALKTQATELDLRGMRLDELPKSLSELAQLESLDAGHNRLKWLPKSLSNLTKLKKLNLDHNNLTSLPEWLGDLNQLKTLGLRNNQLQALPESIGQLAQLQELEVSYNKLTALPTSLTKLTALVRIGLHGNDSLGIPAELLGPIDSQTQAHAGPGVLASASPRSILDYYLRARRSSRPLNEAKLILVGRGGVGKTCLVKRLIQDTFDEYEEETPGIEIQTWGATLPGGEAVRLHVWDFGGQEILHATHQLFLTERTLYLVVLSGREGKPDQDAEYWLQLIRSFGGDSKVIVALNKSAQHPFDVNRGYLLEKYPFIAEFVKTDCDTRLGISGLQRLLLEQTEALDHRKVVFPAEWFEIKEHLTEMHDDYISWPRFQEICRSLGEQQPRAQQDLADYFHILGIALNYRQEPRLQDTHVLNPRWVTEGIYPLLRAGQISGRQGVLESTDLGRVLDSKRYPREKHDFLLRLMELFQLCFRLPERRHKPNQWLVPELLGENQPDIKALLNEPGLGFRYQYQVLPEGLLPRFIVQTHTHSAAKPEFRWRTGVVLQWNDCRAVVRADYRDHRVDIHVTGPETRRRELLAVARAAFDEQHRDLKGLEWQERVQVPDEPDVTVSYQDLLKREERKEKHFYPENMDKPVSVQELLNGIESEESRKRKKEQEQGQPMDTSQRNDPAETQVVRKTVVELDLKGYSDTARELEEHFNPEVGLRLNDQIQSLIDVALTAAGTKREDAVMSTTGDGAILVFDEPSIGHRFAEAFHSACKAHNRQKTVAAAQRWFRVGIATGELAIETSGAIRKFAGSVIVRAVRLEQAANIGEILSDMVTFDALPDELKSRYGDVEQIAGKREEKFIARRCVVV